MARPSLRPGFTPALAFPVFASAVAVGEAVGAYVAPDSEGAEGLEAVRSQVSGLPGGCEVFQET
jgi:hypothetical protein